MTDYPLDFGNGYKIQTVFANKTEAGHYGDIYDFRSEVERAHPGAEVMTGYCVIDEALVLIPEGCNDWNDSISEAIQDYEDHVVPILKRDDNIELNHTKLDAANNTISFTKEELEVVKSALDLIKQKGIPMKQIDILKKQWAYAMGVMKELGAHPNNDQMTLSGHPSHYKVIIHSRDFGNCLYIEPRMTESDIRNAIEREIRTRQIHAEKEREFRELYPNIDPYSTEGLKLYNNKLDFIFDEEIMISDDHSKLDGYVWATDSLVDRLVAQEQPLSAWQYRENINFYPVYDVQHGTISLQGHYHLMDTGKASGTGMAFELSLSQDEASRLMDAFEAYCKETEGMSCLDFLNGFRKEDGLAPLPEKTFSARIQSATSRAAQQTTQPPKEEEITR